MMHTTLPIFLDANVPTYAGGREHPLRQPSVRVLTLVAGNAQAFLTDVEVIRELFHRYTALRAWDAGRPVVTGFAALMEGRMESFTPADIGAAIVLADEYRDIAAHDLVHVAVMRRLQLSHIVSADRDFDRIEGVERLDPVDVESWQALLAS